MASGARAFVRGAAALSRPAAVALGIALVARTIAGQDATARQAPPAARRVEGRVMRPGASSMVPVPAVWVTLHRVGADSAGPLDSTRTGATGAYAFTYRPWGSDEAVYFVSVSYAGIAYFGEPLRADVVRGTDGEITVFDTTSTPLPIAVRGRHLIVSAPAESGARTVTEVYELANDSTLTAVAPPDGATFTAILPEVAAEPRVAGGDVAAEAVSFARGRAAVGAAFAPGMKQLVLAYTLAPAAFPLSVPMLGGADVLEVLVEDPTASVSGAGLAAVDPASVSGRTFKRFLARDVPAGAVVRVVVAQPPAMGRTRYLALLGTVVGVTMLGALLTALRSRRRAARLTPADHGPARAERLAREIAALDATFERQGAPDPEAKERYAERRAELKAQLTATLASRETD